MNAAARWLAESREQKIPWKKWGPYLSERQWDTVREDDSDNGASHQTGWTGVIARGMHLFATTSAEQVLELGKMAGHTALEVVAQRSSTDGG